MAKARKVEGYQDARQVREKLATETYQYRMPFNYDNVTVFRKFYDGGEFHGVELEPVNPRSERAEVDQCEPGKWFKIVCKVTVPPPAARARFQLEVAQQGKKETLLIDDASSRVVGGGKSQLKNGGFEQIDKKTGLPAGWEFLTAGTGKAGVTEKDSHGGRRAMLVEGVRGIALWQKVKVKEGQELVWSVWLRSSVRKPKSICLFPKFYDKNGHVVSDVAGDCIVVRESRPIVRVAVIGSACTPPGYVQVECEELESWRRKDEVKGVTPVRFRINSLWGMHLRADQWYIKSSQGLKAEDGKPYEEIPQDLIDVYPGLIEYGVKSDFQEFPMAGMSSAIFEIPPSKKVTIRGGCEMPGWASDLAPNDGHYSFRMIRTTVLKGSNRR